MAREQCSYCEEEKRKSDLKWNYALQAYICQECRAHLKEASRGGTNRNYYEDDEDGH